MNDTLANKQNLIVIDSLRRKQYLKYRGTVKIPVTFKVWLEQFSPELPPFLLKTDYRASSLRYYINTIELEKV
jgi:hypothetical protein